MILVVSFFTRFIFRATPERLQPRLLALAAVNEKKNKGANLAPYLSRKVEVLNVAFLTLTANRKI